MKDVINKAMQIRIAILYFLLFSLNSLMTSIIMSFLNTDWETLTSQKRFLLICVIMQSWTGTILAFMYKTATKVQEGKSILVAETTTDTTVITKKEQ